jgi:hypothetical protein
MQPTCYEITQNDSRAKKKNFFWGGYITTWGGYIEIWGGYITTWGGYIEIWGGNITTWGGYIKIWGGYVWCGFWGILGPPSYGIGATIRIGREMLCLPYVGFFSLSALSASSEVPSQSLPEQSSVSRTAPRRKKHVDTSLWHCYKTLCRFLLSPRNSVLDSVWISQFLFIIYQMKGWNDSWNGWNRQE